MELKIYGADFCNPCKQAKKYLDRIGVHYTYVDLKENPVSVVVHDIDSLPEQYKRRTEKVEADKTRLKADREKIEFEGVEFVKTKKLVMK